MAVDEHTFYDTAVIFKFIVFVAKQCIGDDLGMSLIISVISRPIMQIVNPDFVCIKPEDLAIELNM